jgi:LPXTG-site transpeptidase (sortase) family protein
MQPSLYEQISVRKLPFLITFFVVFTVSYGILALVDFLPEPKSTDEATSSATVATSTVKPVVTPTEVTPAKIETAAPINIILTSLDREVPVLNPESRDIAVLDAALLQGVVRHPDSAMLGEDGNVLILGHSSYLPNVMNKNFQALNGIQKMKWGDTITLESEDRSYTYRVEKVYQSKASGVTIPTDVKGKRLTLVTCNSFGSKEDRFIVEATLISEKAF